MRSAINRRCHGWPCTFYWEFWPADRQCCFGATGCKFVQPRQTRIAKSNANRYSLVSTKAGGRLVKKALVAGIAAAAFYATAAMAADMAVKAPPVASALLYDWNGCYVGGNVGGIQSKTPVEFLPAGPSFDNNKTSVAGGVQAGCNYMTAGRWVAGIEGDWSWMNLNAATPTLFPGESYRTDWDWTSSLRGRLGYAPDNTLWYITGGPAWAHQTAAQFVETPPLASTADISAIHSGWTIGAGVEHAFNQNWILGVEYLYAKYDSHTYVCATCGPVSFSNQTNEVRLRLSYKFGGPWSTAVSK